jgi:hypothetical protein
MTNFGPGLLVGVAITVFLMLPSPRKKKEAAEEASNNRV